MYYHITMKSTNSKTGPITVTTASQETCENSGCALFKSKLCYAGPDKSGGPLSWFWHNVTTGKAKNIHSFSDHVKKLKNLVKGSPIRLFQAGQYNHTKRGTLNRNELRQFIAATKHLKPISYVHTSDIDTVKWANDQGFPLIHSANTIEDIDIKVPNSVVISHENERGATETFSKWRNRLRDKTNLIKAKTGSKGRVFVCPAQVVNDVTCASCMACNKMKAGDIVAFIAHGSKKRKITDV